MTAGARPVLVYGLGRSGLAVVRRLAASGRPVVFHEQRPAGADVEEASALGATRVATLDDSGASVAYELCVAAPGVPIDHPDLELLRRAGVEVIGEVEWVWRTVPGHYLGVTGTAGKGTVTTWLTLALTEAGSDAVAGGNIDPALAAVARPGATHVVELSSFQLERCPTFRPDVAVTLNLGEDHLDRHGTLAAYHAAKRAILANLGPAQTLVTNADDPLLEAWTRSTTATVRRFSLAPASASRADAWLEPDAGTLYLDGEPLLSRDELLVRGEHHVANALAVALAATAAGVDRPALLRALRSFQGLPGRYAVAGRVGGITFIEDSIATRPLAVSAALKSSSRPLVWLAGGKSKGVDPASLREIVAERVDLLVAYGESGPAIAHAFEDLVSVVQCRQDAGREALACAVSEAVAFLRARHGGAGTVLLAPLAASFDQFTDYTRRAQVFREVVAALGTTQAASHASTNQATL
jgi:UDP-N-acetylmuramoylalanine--D-glutamate ligase